MKTLYDHPGHFEAKIRILTTEEGGRERPCYNGIRWDVILAENNTENFTFMIWPDFFDENGDSLEKDIVLEGVLNARMCSLYPEVHFGEGYFDGLKVGSEFFCVEGRTKAAKGVVTKLTGIKNYLERKT